MLRHIQPTSIHGDPTPPTDLSTLIRGYRLFARTEGKSPRTIDVVASSVTYLDRFLRAAGLPTDAALLGTTEIRMFILYLQEKRCFSDHRFTHVQDRGLSATTVNNYLRAIRSFWSWLVSEEIVPSNPLMRMKLPKAPRKVTPTFSDEQLGRLLAAIDTATPAGFRDQAIMLTLLDTALRVSELVGVTLDNLWLDEGLITVRGKGDRERQVPIGSSVQRILWRYVTRYRARPALPQYTHLFLTHDGRPLTKDRVEKIVARYGRAAGIRGVRCSPHTFRHAAAVRFLRRGGNVFALQRLLGHTSLEMSRRYCELADIDVKAAHITASPVDNFVLKNAKTTPQVYTPSDCARPARGHLYPRPRARPRALPPPKT